MSLGKRRTGLRATAALAAFALMVVPSAAMAEDATPTPEPVTTDADIEPAPAPTTNEYALGQSVQVRVNADGLPNSGMINFRWSVSQLTVQGPLDENETVTVPVPEGGHLTRYLDKMGKPSVDNGIAEMQVDVADGYGTARTVSLVPDDYKLPVSMTTKFWLDGQEVSAQDIVGKTGVVRAEYTISNDSTTPTEVTINEGTDTEEVVTVDAQTPMLFIGKTLLPQSYTGMKLIGLGSYGADGRGNNQVQWLGLPFKPLSSTGVSTFGWTANVRDGKIPSMLIQVAPFYIPEGHGGGEEVEEAVDAASPINLDPGLAQASAGLSRILAAFDMLGGDGTDPLDELQDSINNFFQQFGADLKNLAAQLDPNNPDSATALLPQAIEVLNTISGPLGGISENWDEVVNALTIAEGALSPLTCKLIADQFPGGEQQCNDLDALLGTVLDNADRIQGNLDVIVPVLGTLTSVLVSLNETVQSLSQSVGAIAQGLQDTNVDLPALDAVISSIVASLLASPFGQELTAGLGEVGTGIDLIVGELTAFLAQVITQIQTGAVPAVNALKANLGGMVQMAHKSPLVYGPETVSAPEGTALAGAYEFRVDAADSEHPNTLPRILLGVVLLVGAGAITVFMRRRKEESPVDSGVTTE